jgi:hypothetical protein
MGEPPRARAVLSTEDLTLLRQDCVKHWSIILKLFRISQNPLNLRDFTTG